MTQNDSTTVSANIDAGMPWRRSYGDNIVYTDWRRDNYCTPCSRSSAPGGVSAGRLGVEDDHISPDLRAKVPDALPEMHPRRRRRGRRCGSG